MENVCAFDFVALLTYSKNIECLEAWCSKCAELLWNVIKINTHNYIPTICTLVLGTNHPHSRPRYLPSTSPPFIPTIHIPALNINYPYSRPGHQQTTFPPLIPNVEIPAKDINHLHSHPGYQPSVSPPCHISYPFFSWTRFFRK